MTGIIILATFTVLLAVLAFWCKWQMVKMEKANSMSGPAPVLIAGIMGIFAVIVSFFSLIGLIIALIVYFI